jgi:cytochrome c556
MMIKHSLRNSIVILLVAAASAAGAADDVAAEREELMEGVRDAAKPVGAMLKGEREFDADVLQASLSTFADAGEKLGGLVPEGSEGGGAAPAVWEDPDGFATAIKELRDATAAAIEANPQSLDQAKPVVGPVFSSCKNCHDTYRIDEDED